MTKVSERLNRLAESATLAMARMSRELQAKGIDVIALSLGEPDFDTPEFIKEAAKKAIASLLSAPFDCPLKSSVGIILFNSFLII